MTFAFPNTLTLENLPATTTEQVLVQLFKPYGPVNVCITDTVATIHFVIAGQANKAFVMLSDRPLPNSEATVQFQSPVPAPEPKSGLLVRNLGPKITESDLFDLFAQFGPLYSCTVNVRARSEVSATLQYFVHDHAQRAVQEMHCSDVEGNLISVSICDTSGKRSSKQSSASGSSVGNATTKPRTPLNIAAAPFNPPSGWVPLMQDSPESVDVVPTAQLSSMQSQQQYVDYTNLYIKNLDESVTSTDLFHYFKPFGRIVSARVIINAQTNQSRGYGFVSYSRPDEAVYALNQMNGVTVASKPVVVAFHEPKKPRILPLSPRSPIDSSLPIPGYSSDSSGQDRGDLYQDIYNSIVSSGLVWDNNVQQVTDVLAQLPRQEQASLLSQPLKLIEKVKDTRDSLGLSPVIEMPKSRPINIRSPSLSADSKEEVTRTIPVSESDVSSPTSSSTPQIIPLASPVLSASSQDLPPGGPPEGIVQRLRRSGTSTSESTMSEQREKLAAAVNQIDPSAGDDCIDMLMTLSAKERSTCIFNPEYLRTKLSQARHALDIFADENVVPPMPSSFQPKAPIRNGKDTRSAEEFYKTISHLSSYEQKQKLGDRLFPLVKATGVKQAPKVTIRLLDTIDLPWLSQIMTPDNPELNRLAKSAFETL